MIIIITPCLLGFDVRSRRGVFERCHGIYESFGKLLLDLMFTEDLEAVVLR